jgi:hypothetical protein
MFIEGTVFMHPDSVYTSRLEIRVGLHLPTLIL